MLQCSCVTHSLLKKKRPRGENSPSHMTQRARSASVRAVRVDARVSTSLAFWEFSIRSFSHLSFWFVRAWGPAGSFLGGVAVYFNYYEGFTGHVLILREERGGFRTSVLVCSPWFYFICSSKECFALWPYQNLQLPMPRCFLSRVTFLVLVG